MKIKTLTSIILFMFTTILCAQTPIDKDKRWGLIVKSETPQEYSRIFSGTVHIGPHGATLDASNNILLHATHEALLDSQLHVQGVILSEGNYFLDKDQFQNYGDFVFEDTYQLMSLKELENYIVLNKHLPDVPTKAEVVENGLESKQMHMTQLIKIEELTLYVIALNKALEAEKKRNDGLLKRLEEVEAKLNLKEN